MSFSTQNYTLAADLADTANALFAYPTGTTQSQFTNVNAGAGNHVIIIDGNSVYKAADGDFTVGFGGSGIQITNTSGETWKAGAELKAQFDQRGVDSSYQTGLTTNPISRLSNQTGGTASDTLVAIGGTYDQAEVANNFSSLASKVNGLLAELEAIKVVGK